MHACGIAPWTALTFARATVRAPQLAPEGSDDGPLILGDEVLTPDCSRYWPKDGYAPGKEQPSYDKQYVRDYLKSIGFDKKTPIALPKEVRATLRTCAHAALERAQDTWR